MIDKPESANDAPTPDQAPARGRPALSQDVKTKRKDEIADVALRLFLEEGFASVSMRRLGKEVKLSPMALYRYFPSKLDILARLWAFILTQAFDRVAKARQDQTNHRDALHLAAQAYVTYWLENTDHYHLVFVTSGVTKETVQSFVGNPETIAQYDVFFELVASVLGLDRANPTVKTATDGLICALHGIMHSLITMPGYPWTRSEQLVSDAVSSIRERSSVAR
ncbi:MAG: TetR/AcrR family transcriptional regulator [Rhodobacteraceae bacterium]|nr:TetR/AcrR family transcriptional regulator [Paracoccaceae bacterium]